MASGPLLVAVRLAGAAYLIYVGGLSLLKAARNTDAAAESGPPVRRLSPASALWQGFLSHLSNVKMVAFFISLFPQFAGPHPSFAVLLLLGFNFGLLTLAWPSGYAIAVERMRHVIRRASVRRRLDALLGAVLVGLGLRLSAEVLAG